MKQIFDWLREQMRKEIVCNHTTPIKAEHARIIAFENSIKLVNEAEAKWESDCCEWKYDDEEDYYETSCGNLQIIMGGTPTENGYRFCLYCGRKIVEVE